MPRTPPSPAIGSCIDLPAEPFFAVEEAELDEPLALPVVLAVLPASLLALLAAAVGCGVALLKTCPTVGRARLGSISHPPGVEDGHAGGVNDEAEFE